MRSSRGEGQTQHRRQGHGDDTSVGRDVETDENAAGASLHPGPESSRNRKLTRRERLNKCGGADGYRPLSQSHGAADHPPSLPGWHSSIMTPSTVTLGFSSCPETLFEFENF